MKHVALIGKSKTNSKLGRAQVMYGDLKEADGLSGFIECDTSSWEAQLAMFKQAVEQLGRLDVVIANAGIGGNEELMSLRMVSTPQHGHMLSVQQCYESRV